MSAITKDDIVVTETGYKMARITMDREKLSAAVKGFLGMFDREIYDMAICIGTYSTFFAGTVCDKTKKAALVCSNPECIGKKISPGMKTVIFSDVLTDGQDVLSVIRSVEKAGGSVIRLGFIAEDSSKGARKARVLRGYPFEALTVI